ncbi:homoserine kinase [Aestuariispira insulae]|uniref:Homoserine kinase n=1 Tax=Aestuariispira insulae TaxID=1461337 RepID=A0A3D9HGG5_9PROT|nr:homoserine kinase [Aestuariispira insulae]RED48579.1 homoserine kinase [Aestuariispira insulae]
MAVYTEVTDDDLESFVADYNVGEVLACKGIAEGVENSNFFLQTQQDSFILTLYEKRVNADDLPFFLELMEHLADRGIRCPLPVNGRDGQSLRRLSGRPAALFTFLEGMWPRKIHPFHCAELGKAMAQFHVAGLDYGRTRANNLTVGNWRPLLESCGGRGDEVKPGLTDFLARELDFLEANWPKDLPRGVIHADMFPDNVFYRGESLSGIIDFYFACTDFLVYDLAICLNAWCFERDGSFNMTKAKLLLGHYRKERALSKAEIDALPVLARGAAMRFLLTRLYDWINHPEGAFVKPKDPMEYLRYLTFHQSVTGPSAYGIGE